MGRPRDALLEMAASIRKDRPISRGSSPASCLLLRRPQRLVAGYGGDVIDLAQ
jgi:hypothetical protein